VNSCRLRSPDMRRNPNSSYPGGGVAAEAGEALDRMFSQATADVPGMCPGDLDAVLRRRSAPYGVSRPVGRVLCARLRGAAVIHLGLPLPAASCGLPAGIGRAALDRSRREPRFPS